MSQSSGWQKQLTFSDRLSLISKMQVSVRSYRTEKREITGISTDAYKEASPGCESSDASRHAKSEETIARKEATSLEEYHELCARAIGRLLPSRPQATSDELEYNSDSTDLSGPTTQIGRYTDARHWKDGISSDIYQARDPETGQTVALKVTTPAMMTAPHDSIREARVLTAARSSNIISLLESFQQHDRFVLTFPFMPYDLGTLLQRNQLSESLKRTVLHDLFAGLAHLHSLGIIHRDIKPSNILLPTLRGPAYIADLGTAWSSSDSASEPANTKHLEVGTTSYRPPELLFGKQDYGPKLDMWAAGCVAAQVLKLGGTTLFDSGDLGSELALIKSIFEILRTPDLEAWPEAATLPDWGKMKFTEYPGKSWSEILPGLWDDERDLVSRLIIYESGNRLSAEQALQHPYFSGQSMNMYVVQP